MTELPPITAVPAWPGGYSAYPGSKDEFATTREDAVTIKDVNDVAAAIKAIEGILGTNPAGAHPTIRLALESLQTTLDGLSAYQDQLNEISQDLASEIAILAAIPGPPNTYYRFIQGSPITPWVIHHTLGRYPSVMITDSAGTVVEGEIAYDSVSQITVTFSAAFAGEAYLS